ncbi:MAG: DUF1592 domain-containing protein [Myxococcota bacterium]
MLLAVGCTGRIGEQTPLTSSTDGGPADVGGEVSDRCQGVDTEQPTPVIVARMTRTEYIRTIRDIFGVDISGEAATLPFEVRAPFSTTSIAQSIDISHVEVFSNVSERIVSQVGDIAERYATCIEFTEACETALIRAAGAEVFRRPLRDEEVSPYRRIFRVVQGESDTFAVAARLVLRSMLQSPQFIYHLEDRRGNEVRRLSSHELARRIAYLVWQSAPDDVLVTAADAGALSTASQIEAQIRRMGADPRAHEASLAFFEDWVDLTRLERAVRDLDDEVKDQMREETERMVRSVLWDQNGGLIDLIGAQYTYATPELAERYGLASQGDGWRRYDLSEVSSRRGILTQGSLLAAHANGNRPAFVSRGLFLLRTMLCRDVPDPTAGVDTTITELPETASEREKSAERLSRGSCGACHAVFDPLAYAFEGYSGAGVLRSLDQHGNSVRTDGWVPALFGAGPDTPAGRSYPYSDVSGLIDVLVAAPFVRECMAQKPLGFALRRQLDDVLADECAVREVAATTQRLGGSYLDLLVAVATHPQFTHIAAIGDQ